MKQLSTTALAKSHNLPAKTLFNHFQQQGYLQKNADNWELTTLGQQQGGAYKESKQYGTYIVWPEDIKLDIKSNNNSNDYINATNIGKHFQLSANKINYVLSELGWLKKYLKGWHVTKQSIKQGGIQSEDKKSGVPYVRWPQTLCDNKTLINTIAQLKGIDNENDQLSISNDDSIEFREKFPAKHRSADGHMVRSKAEMLIDNWLYMAEIVHAYERKLPIEENVYSDFYIPTGKVYIEYWGYEDDPKYQARKQQKIAIYQKYGFNLIELQDKDVQNLDDVLPRMLLKYGVQAY